MNWGNAPANLELVAGELHVWQASLGLPAQRMEQLEHPLSSDEHERAGRFHFEKDRKDFIAARGILRELLGRYAGLSARALIFSYTDSGKPVLSNSRLAGVLRFNVAHSHGIAMYAFVLGRDVGIDVEYQRGDLIVEEVARGVCSQREMEALRSLPEAQQRTAFFDCWTRKEAYIKARGQGFVLPLDQIDITPPSGKDPAPLSTKSGPPGDGPWMLHDVAPETGYSAAVVYAGSDLRMKCWRWPG
jgi:4'-phosphopantetheinyl transferase